jgi:hypothetical protein
MNTQFKALFICLVLLTSLPSCMVTKCRYSNGWNLGLGRGVEYSGVQVAKSNKAVSRKAAKDFNDSLVKDVFATILKSDSTVSSVDNNSFFNAPSYSAQKVQLSHQAIGKDSIKNTEKYKKKKSKARRRYQSNIFDYIPDNEYEYILFLFLIGLIIIGFILWALYSLIRLPVRALRKDKDLPPDTATISPNSKDLQVGKDAGSTKEIAQQQVSFEGDTTFDHTNEMNEYTEEELELEEENKSKLLNFLLVGLLTIGLVFLMALGMKNQ